MKKKIFSKLIIGENLYKSDIITRILYLNNSDTVKSTVISYYNGNASYTGAYLLGIQLGKKQNYLS